MTQAVQIVAIKKQEEMKTVVVQVLAENQRARNDDNFLILKVLEHMGFDIAITKEGFLWHGDFEHFSSIPRFETITRCRRDIQNTDGHWLPTDTSVMIKRGLSEELIREYYSGNKEVVSDWQQAFYKVK